MIVAFYIGIFLFLGLCFLLSFIILIQESKSLGLGASFGGDAGSSVFGTSTADVLKKITAWLAVLFFAMCLLFSFFSGAVRNNKVVPPLDTNLEIQ
jgi:preprotein translocase subunit SecG